MAGKKATSLNPYTVIAFGVLTGLAGAALIILLTRPPRGTPIELQPAPTPGAILVYVSGAVPAPGTYRLNYGSRVEDAVAAAGGALEDANLDAINLARELDDGDQVHIPEAGSDDVVFPINFNNATLEQLSQLPGIGPVTAQAIIDYRQAKGPFGEPEEIQNVAGIGPSTYEAIADYIITGN
jgi:competence protein ComEA